MLSWCVFLDGDLKKTHLRETDALDYAVSNKLSIAGKLGALAWVPFRRGTKTKPEKWARENCRYS